MRFTEVTVCVDDLEGAERWYDAVLGLQTSRERSPDARDAGGPEGASVLVRIGSTLLRLVRRSREAAGGHLAFTIPADGFDAAKRWLSSRVELLAQEGRDEFEGPPGWDSRSLYFGGPAGCVLELIARRRLPDRLGEAPFTGAHLLAVSEVGVAVPDVPAAARLLQRQAGLGPFAAPPGDTFAAVGDERGLLILAAEGRTWLPTPDRPARPSFQRVAAEGDGAVDLLVGGTELCIRAASDDRP